MEAAFSWIGHFAEAIGKLVPRLRLVRATHAGVKWQRGKPKSMMPGLHWFWPLTTDVELIVTARQTLNLPTQVLMTKDREKVVVGTVVVYKIKDVVQAIGQRNWDVDTTIGDITQTAIVSVIAKSTLEELLTSISDETVNERLTTAVRQRLRPFGVAVRSCSITDFSDVRVYRLINNETKMASPLAG